MIGIGEAGFHVASLIARALYRGDDALASPSCRSSIICRYGLTERCARVRAAEVPVLALEERNADALAKISAEITRRERR